MTDLNPQQAKNLLFFSNFCPYKVAFAETKSDQEWHDVVLCMSREK
jgi:hypothetical protein